MSDLEKTLKRMKVTLKTVELITTPGHGFSPATRCWRVILSKDVGEEKPVRLTFTMLSPKAPDIAEAILCLIRDIEDAEMNLWEFAQAYNRGKTDEGTERMHKSCKRTVPRVNRFFGNSWNLVSNKALDNAA